MTAKKSDKKTEENLERIYIIPLREKCRHVPRYKKTSKAIKSIKEFLARHMKVRDRDLNKIKIDKYLNEFLWSRGIRNPPHKVKVKSFIDSEGIVRAELAEITKKLQQKKIREEKFEKAGEEKKKKKAAEAQPEKSEQEKKAEEEKKDEEEEKKSAVVEAGAKLEKAAAKKVKHQVGGKTKEPKRQFRQALQK